MPVPRSPRCRSGARSARAGGAARVLARALLAAALALPALGCPDRDAVPAPGGLLESERNTVEIFRRTADSVVFVSNAAIRLDARRLNVLEVQHGTGSGFIWDERGHVVTNYHVIQGGDRFTVTLADRSIHPAHLIGIAPRKDLAVLAIETPDLVFEPLQLGDSTDLEVGQKVLAIGNPFGLDGSLTTGVISALGREIQSVVGTVIEDVIQTDASINPGSSGGPLLDSSGQLIGVTTSIYSPTGASTGVGFAVPVATVSRIVPQLIEHGRVKWPGLGIATLPDSVTARWGLPGVGVRQVLPGSPAERAGLRSLQVDRLGAVRSLDVITAIDGRPVGSLMELLDVLDDHRAGDVVSVRYLRDGQQFEAQVALRTLD